PSSRNPRVSAPAYRTGSTFIVPELHSPALGVHACGARSLLKQMRASCSSPEVQEVRKAALGKLGLAAAKACSTAPGLSVCVWAGALNSSGIVTESRTLRTVPKESSTLKPLHVPCVVHSC